MRPILARSHVDLLERSLVAHLATVRRNGQPQSSVVRPEWDGRLLRVPFAPDARELANLEHEPRVALTIVDPDADRSLEVRADVESVEDAGDAIVIVLRPTTFLAHADGEVVRATQSR